MRILIVDDDIMILKIMELKLKSFHHRVMVASCGLDAVKLITQFPFDMVISDILMEDITGVDILKLVKTIPDKNIKVILLSTLGQEEIVLEAFSYGADDYITKPFSPNVLAARVNRFDDNIAG